MFFDLQAAAGALLAAQRQLFAEELRTDAPHMKVTPVIRKIADETCGPETDLVVQSRALLNYVAEHAEPVNTMIIGYAEIDGGPARVLPEGDKPPQLARTIRFTE